MPPLSNSKIFKIRSHCANLFAHSTAHSVVQLRHPVKRWQYGLSTTASTMQCFPDIQARYSSRWWGWISQSQCCVCSCRGRSTVGETTPLDDNLNTSTPHAYRGTQVNDNTKKTVNIATTTCGGSHSSDAIVLEGRIGTKLYSNSVWQFSFPGSLSRSPRLSDRTLLVTGKPLLDASSLHTCLHLKFATGSGLQILRKLSSVHFPPHRTTTSTTTSLPWHLAQPPTTTSTPTSCRKCPFESDDAARSVASKYESEP
jgi:hypothetical protein